MKTNKFSFLYLRNANCFSILLLSLIFTAISSAQEVWSIYTSNISSGYNAVAWTGDSFIICGGNEIVFTRDGSDYVENTASQGITFGYIAGNGKTIIAAADLSTDSTSLWRMLKSSDGMHWTTLRSYNPRNVGYAIHNIIYANNQFITVGDSVNLRNKHFGRIMTSPDGDVWTDRQSGTEYALNSVAYGGGTYVAVGEFGTILSSTDNGVTWTDYSFTADIITDITYGDNKFVAISIDTAVFISPDGISWTRKGMKGTAGIYFHITFGAKTFVAVSQIGDYSGIFSSPDAITWTRQQWTSNAFAQIELYDIEYANNIFCAVGDTGGTYTKGVILTSPAITSVFHSEKTNPAKVQLPIITCKSIEYSLSSTNLVSIKLYDIRGRLSKTLINSFQPSGKYSLPLSSGLSAGRYVVSFRVGAERIDKAIVITR